MKDDYGEGMKDYYKILRVRRTARPKTIRAAYRRLAKECHPDVSQDPAAPERMRQLNEAYEVLSDPRRRAEYDASLRPAESEWERAASAPSPPTYQGPGSYPPTSELYRDWAGAPTGIVGLVSAVFVLVAVGVLCGFAYTGMIMLILVPILSVAGAEGLLFPMVCATWGLLSLSVMVFTAPSIPWAYIRYGRSLWERRPQSETTSGHCPDQGGGSRARQTIPNPSPMGSPSYGHSVRNER